jgi:hypothetical protein
MAKKAKVVTETTTAETTVVAATNGVLYEIGKLPRNGLNEGTKHGTGGTAGTYLAVVAALKDGPLGIEAIKAVCKSNNDAGFARYAVRNHWLLPVATK